MKFWKITDKNTKNITEKHQVYPLFGQKNRLPIKNRYYRYWWHPWICTFSSILKILNNSFSLYGSEYENPQLPVQELKFALWKLPVQQIKFTLRMLVRKPSAGSGQSGQAGRQLLLASCRLISGQLLAWIILPSAVTWPALAIGLIIFTFSCRQSIANDWVFCGIFHNKMQVS